MVIGDHILITIPIRDMVLDPEDITEAITGITTILITDRDPTAGGMIHINPLQAEQL